MVPSLPDLPPPLSFICVIAILIVYVFCCYLVIDFISSRDEESRHQLDSAHNKSSYCYLLSAEELQKITCLYHEVGPSRSICAICLENLRQAQVCRVLPACRHEFHAQCLDPWFSQSFSCPTCRVPFRPRISVEG